jgi:hypothetical protein
VGALAAVVVTVVLASRGGDGGSVSSTTGPVTTTPDSFFAVVPPPSDVVVSRTPAGSVQVAFRSADGTTVELRRVDGGHAGDPPVTAPTSPVALDAAATEVPCVVARARGEGGRISRDVGPVCLSG